ncbi:response regulator [Emcibacter sp. SYSU 3D8]|uniref:response regulator n=1 Tax=Emcibacter sp. SYSU 3D8 TaxID=3133969 RepID=UPI0031FECD52
MRETSILLVEDDPAISMIVEEMMIDLGMSNVTTAGRLPAAVEAASSGGFDCAIVDLKLHGQDTFEVARILTKRNIPFAFFTGYSADTLREYAEQPVLPKPFAESDLKAILDHLLKVPGGA